MGGGASKEANQPDLGFGIRVTPRLLDQLAIEQLGLRTEGKNLDRMRKLREARIWKADLTDAERELELEKQYLYERQQLRETNRNLEQYLQHVESGLESHQKEVERLKLLVESRERDAFTAGRRQQEADGAKQLEIDRQLMEDDLHRQHEVAVAAKVAEIEAKAADLSLEVRPLVCARERSAFKDCITAKNADILMCRGLIDAFSTCVAAHQQVYVKQVRQQKAATA
eukprot:TRINITY_DN14017_c0_g1_i1.p1 TRINITY_DN14017_c0_g1~~TRINITY_DN14017_c0_g1_i1.p1  ORF type:complete len:227 (+),score=54.51 TRINITY_DN14017_c0_g1_i1:135-815(+)